MKYSYTTNDYELWRLSYGGGEDFINRYLVQFSQREISEDFENRKKISYCPAFAKAAINEVKNAIFQRLSEVKRINGPKLYSQLINGKEGGVDGIGSSMEHFIGQYILPELLVMAKVGIFVDRQPLKGERIIDAANNYPYCYYYTREQILNITYDRNGKIIKLLLEECNSRTEDIFGLNIINEKDVKYKYVFLNDAGNVVIRYYDKNPVNYITNMVDTNKPSLLESDTVTKLTEIPFVLVELSDSLMRDIAKYQVALLNMASSDLNYILKANVPFYVEQISTAESMNKQMGSAESGSTTPEMSTGPMQGRRYAAGLDAPNFIHPSPEPLRASMERQEACKAEIRLLLNLNITNLKPTKAISAESKAKDEGSLESGLSYIGLALQHAERAIARFICSYLNIKNDIQVNYPEKYSLKTEEERRLEAKELTEQVAKATSKILKRELLKKIAELTLGNSVSEDTLAKIKQEINTDSLLISQSDIITLVQSKIIDKEWAVLFMGFPKESVQEEPDANTDDNKSTEGT